AAAQEEQPGTEQIELNKTATIKTGSGDAQLFDVDLSVKGATVHEEKLLDVVLILDASSSMSQSLINATKNAAKTFVDGIYANSNIDARIAVVKYGDTASARDFSTSSAWDEYGRTVYGSEHYSNNKSDINKAIDTLSRNGATNTEGAFLVANELALLKRTGAEHITVFMTDGVPTKRYTTGTNTDSNGSYTELNDYNDALSAAIALSANSVIYNVGLTAGLDEYPYDNLIAEKFMEQPPYAMTQDSNNDRRTPSFSSTPYANYAKAYYNITSSNANEIATEMAQIYADIAIEAMNLATGKVVDVIPADFVLANESDLRANAAAAGYGITITNNADGTTTVEYTGVDAGDTLKTLPTITVQYTGDGYGAEYTNVTAYYEGALYNGEAFSKPFPKPVAGVRPVTDVDTATALVNEPILIDVAANDPFDQLVLPGYTVSNYAIIITDEHGNVKNYTDAANQFTAVVKDGKVEFVSSTDSTKQFYYVISATITANAGYSDSALPADGKLISKPTLVTVNLIPKINITVTKEWKAPNDVIHPDITINLLQDGQPY
ncbi:MAG: VWA domain-containing protein, partial [Peptococcaceae bacterium]|nr:VWA domain-containing protein [Peptococcaceae bacterium]